MTYALLYPQTTSDEYVSMSSHHVSSHLTPPDDGVEPEWYVRHTYWFCKLHDSNAMAVM